MTPTSPIAGLLMLDPDGVWTHNPGWYTSVIKSIRAAVTAISDLYHRRGGTMKMCRYYPGGRCLRTECYIEGCNRAQEALKGLDGDNNDE